MRLLPEMAIFAKVGELASISAAARVLGLPKSSVSRAVSKLEAAFEARLVERSTRRLTLTEIGLGLLAHCQKLVIEAENAEAEIAAYQGHPSGRLRIASPSSIGQLILKANIPEFLDRYPDVDIELQLTDRLINPVTEGYDVVIRAGELEDSSLIARKITDIDAALMASRGYAEQHGIPQTIEELSGHPVVGLPRAGMSVIELVSGNDRAQIPVWPRFACNDPMMNLELVERGIAIATISRLLTADRIKAGELIPVLPKYRLQNPPAVYALYAGRTALSPKIGVFLDFLAELAKRITADPSLVRF